MSDVATTERADPDAESIIAGGGERPPSLAGGSVLFGHLRELGRDNLALFARCAALHGIAQFRVYWYQCHIVTDPELVGQLLIGQAAAFRKTRALQIARPTFGDGLVTSEGERWRRQQRLLRGFFTPRAAASYAVSVAEATARKLDTWSRHAPVDLHPAMIDISLDIVCSALFGMDASRVRPFIRDASLAVQQWHSDCQVWCLPYPQYLPTLSNARYRARTRALNRAVFALIRAARGAPDAAEVYGLLGTLLRVATEQEAPLANQQIRDEVVTLFLAGHDTTASSLAFTLYELAFRPDLQDRIAQEAAFGASETLEQVLKEALRLYPAVHLVARTALRDVMLGRYLVRRNEELVVPLYVLHRLPSLFPDPEAFQPERWARAEREPACPRHAHLPFSAGPRVCTGQAVAMAELRQVVTATVSRFRLSPVAPRNPRIEAHMTLSPAAKSTYVRVLPRTPA